VLAVQIIPELTIDTEPELGHDSSTNALIRQYRSLNSREVNPVGPGRSGRARPD
jgi:hypothetical protein